MKSAGIVRSAYHFFHCDADPAAQATFFLGVMGALEPGDLPPSLDFEDTTTCAPSTGIAMAIEWLDAVASATGTLPILYTSVNVLSQFQNTQSLAGHAQLWVASRGVTCPDLPAPFAAWSFWQYSLTGTAPGLPNSNGMADLDQFNGDMSALLGLTVGGSADASSGAGSDSGPPCMVGGVAGTCIDTSVCNGMPGYVSTPGLCPGPASEECCTREGDDASSGGGGDGAGDAGGASNAADSGGTGKGGGCSVGVAGGANETAWWPLVALVTLLAARGRGAHARRRPEQIVEGHWSSRSALRTSWQVDGGRTRERRAGLGREAMPSHWHIACSAPPPQEIGHGPSANYPDRDRRGDGRLRLRRNDDLLLERE